MSDEPMAVFLDEVVPALMAAGLTQAQVVAWSEKVRTRMGGGGSTRQWLEAMTIEVVMLDRPIAERAFLLAVEQAVKRINGRADA